MPASRNSFMNTLCASSIAWPSYGSIGDASRCPELPCSVEKTFKLGTPNEPGSLSFPTCSSVSGKCIVVAVGELRARDRGHLRLHVLPLRGDDFRRTVEAQLRLPEVPALRRGVRVPLRGGAAAGLVEQRGLLRVERAGEHGALEREHAVHDALEREAREDLHERHDVVVLRHADLARHRRLGLRHQPEAHLRDDAQVRLREQPVGRRPARRTGSVATSSRSAARPCRCARTSPFASTTSMPQCAPK